MSPALAGRFFTTEPPGKPVDTSIQDKFLLLSGGVLMMLYSWESFHIPQMVVS